MDAAHCLRSGRQAQPRAQRLRQRLRQLCGEAPHGLLLQRKDVALFEVLRARVHRDDATRAQSLVRGIAELRVLHLQPAAESGDFAAERHFQPFIQPPRHPGPRPPDHPDAPRAVVDDRLGHLPAADHRCAGRPDMADDRLVLPRAQAGDGRGGWILVVADREMEEKVLDRLNVEAFQFRRRPLAHALQHRHRRVQPADYRRRRGFGLQPPRRDGCPLRRPCRSAARVNGRHVCCASGSGRKFQQPPPLFGRRLLPDFRLPTSDFRLPVPLHRLQKLLHNTPPLDRVQRPVSAGRERLEHPREAVPRG